MKRKLILTIALIISLTISCNLYEPKEPSSYLDANNLTWKDAYTAFYHGMSDNYVFWSMDSPSGEWDEQYKANLSTFEDLGKIDQTDDENTKKAIFAFFDSTKNLSDGHFSIYLDKDDKTTYFSPALHRIMKENAAKQGLEFKDEELYELIYNLDLKLGTEEELTANRALYYQLLGDEYFEENIINVLKNDFSCDLAEASDDFLTEYGSKFTASDYAVLYIDQSYDEEDPTYNYKLEASLGVDLSGLNSFFSEWSLLIFYYKEDNSITFVALTGLTNENSALSIPANTLYLKFSSFDFYPYSLFSGTYTFTNVYYSFLHRKNLSGMILDLRCNSGGYNIDRSTLFSYLVKDKQLFAYTRQKIGDNRLDYTPWVPVYMYPDNLGHEDEYDSYPSTLVTKNKPIVLLTNKYSISNSEIVALFIKSLENGTIIGERTFGAMGSLYSSNTVANAGSFSISPAANMSILYAYTPYSQTKAADGTIYEKIGIPPDIEVPFNSGRDDKLYRAFEFISDNQN